MLLQGTFRVAASQPVMYAVEETSNLFHINNKVSTLHGRRPCLLSSEHMPSLIRLVSAC